MAHLAPKSLPIIALILVGTAAAGAQQTAPAPAGSTALEGRWQVELFLDPRSLVNPPPAEKVSGEIAFGTDSWWGNAERFGRYAVDLRPFFGRFFAPPGGATPFSAADTSFLTEASGGIKGDSVVIDFIPRIDHLGLTFRGRFYGDSARGRWYRRGTDGYGPFVLRRVSKEPVQVAAIPDPAKQAAATQAVAKGGRRATSRKQAATAKQPVKTTPQAANAATQVASQTPAKPTMTPVTTAAATAAPQPPPKSETTVASAASTPQATPQQKPQVPPVPNAQGDATRPAAGTSPARSQQLANTPAAQPARAVEGVVVAVTSSPLATPAPARTDPAATGALRVRIFDRASQKWFATKYALRLPDGNWMLANLRTGAGADGWGQPVRRAPGRHEVEIGDFVCGDKIWFLKNKITRAVEVKAGETTDVSVDVDVTAEPAKPSIDNRSGAKCSAPPGAVR